MNKLIPSNFNNLYFVSILKENTKISINNSNNINNNNNNNNRIIFNNRNNRNDGNNKNRKQIFRSYSVGINLINNLSKSIRLNSTTFNSRLNNLGECFYLKRLNSLNRSFTYEIIKNYEINENNEAIDINKSIKKNENHEKNEINEMNEAIKKNEIVDMNEMNRKNLIHSISNSYIKDSNEWSEYKFNESNKNNRDAILTAYQKSKVNEKILPQVTFIGSFLIRKGSMILSKSDLDQLMKELNLNSIDQVKRLVHKTKRVMNLKPIDHQLKEEIRKLILQGDPFLNQHSIISNDKNKLQFDNDPNHLSSSTIITNNSIHSNSSNISKTLSFGKESIIFSNIQKYIQNHLGISGQQSYSIIISEFRNIHRQRITKQHRNIVKENILKYLNEITNSSEIDMDMDKNEFNTLNDNYSTQSYLSIEKFENFEKLDYFQHISNICNRLKGLDLPKVLIYSLINQELQKITKAKISQSQLDYIKTFMRLNPELNNAIEICDKIISHIEIPRQNLYNIILSEIHKNERASISESQKESMRKRIINALKEVDLFDNYSINENLHLNNKYLKGIISDLSNNISIEFDVSRSYAYREIAKELHILRKSLVTKDHIHLVNSTIHQNTESSIQELSDLIFKQTTIPRSVIYNLVKKQKEKIDRSTVSIEQRNKIKEFIEDHLIFPNESNITYICDKLKYLNIPRNALYKVVVSELNSLKRKQIQSGDKEYIQNLTKEHFINLKNGSFTINNLCDMAITNVSISRKQVYEMIRYQYNKLLKMIQ